MARKLKVAESNQAKASLTKPWLATDKANRSRGRLRAIRPTLVDYVLKVENNLFIDFYCLAIDLSHYFLSVLTRNKPSLKMSLKFFKNCSGCSVMLNFRLIFLDNLSFFWIL